MWKYLPNVSDPNSHLNYTGVNLEILHRSQGSWVWHQCKCNQNLAHCSTFPLPTQPLPPRCLPTKATTNKTFAQTLNNIKQKTATTQVKFMCYELICMHANNAIRLKIKGLILFPLRWMGVLTLISAAEGSDPYSLHDIYWNSLARIIKYEHLIVHSNWRPK